MTEEQAHIAVAVILRRREHLHFQHKAAHNNVPNQVDIEGRADFRAVLALFKQSQHLAAGQ